MLKSYQKQYFTSFKDGMVKPNLNKGNKKTGSCFRLPGF